MDNEINNMNDCALTSPGQVLPLVRHLSYRLTPILLKTSMTPNQITTISLVLGLISAACFTQGNWIAGIVGGLLMLVSYIFDNCDGEVARIKKLSSEFGAKLDDMSDSMVDASFFAALGYGTTQASGQQFWFWLGLAAATGAIIDYLIHLIQEAHKGKKPNSVNRAQRASEPRQPENGLDWIIYIFIELSRADFCLIILGLALFNVTWILLPFAAIGAQAYWITGLFERASGYHA